ncbi:S1 family peptidase, partial [Kitasatospora sp. NPDC093558]
MLRLRAAVAACSLAAITVVAGIAPAGAHTDRTAIAAALAAPQTDAVQPSAPMLQALQRDLGLTPQEAGARLAHEARAASVQ